MRKGSLNVVFIIGSIAVGLIGMGAMVGMPTLYVGNVEHQIAETGTATAAKTFAEYVDERFADDAMNWSFYHTADTFAADTSPPVKRWQEDDIATRQELRTVFEQRATDDFRRDHLGTETIEEDCEISSSAFDFFTLEPYASFDGMYGHNWSAAARDPMTVRCTAETGETKVLLAPQLTNMSFKENMSHKARLYWFYNITHNMTHNPGFQARVEGAAMNVSKLLQIETAVENKNCDIDSDGAHSAGYGDGGTGTSGAPYNEGPDCKTDEGDFDTPENSLSGTIDQAEDKYEGAVKSKLHDYVEEWARNNYDNPRDWVPPEWKREGFGDVTIDVEVRELEYKIYNLRGRQGSSDPDVYRDRYVSACKLSDTATFHETTMDFTKNTPSSTPLCSCSDLCPGGCGSGACSSCTTTCDETCTDCNLDDTPIDGPGDCSFTDCGSSSDYPNPSCSSGSRTCSLSNCFAPSFFPVNTNPPLSVRDDGYSASAPEPAYEPYNTDCPGAKTSDGNPRETGACELDNACNVDSNLFDPDGGGDPHSGEDARSWGDEHGEFVKCTNEEDLFNGVNNPWYIQTDDTHPDGVPGGPGEPGWGASQFNDRVFPVAWQTSGPTVREVASPSTAAIRSVRRGFIHNYFDSGGSGGSTDSGSDGSSDGTSDGTSDGDGEEETCDLDCSTRSDSCTYTDSATCNIDLTESELTDEAYEDEVSQTTAEYRFDLKAYVRLKITITDDRYKVPTADGLEPLKFSVLYDQYAIATADDTSPDEISMCELGSTAINPDERHCVGGSC